MPVLSNARPTLLDVARAVDETGQIIPIVEILNTTEEMMADMIWDEGNLITGDRHSVRTGIPAPTWRKLYGGVQPTKSTRTQVTEDCGMMEAYSEVDKAEADLQGNTAQFRFDEATAHIEGMAQDLASTLFYGNTATNPEKFMGLAPRFSDLSTPNGQDNIIDAGGTGSDNRSIWLVCWGKKTVCGIYPKHSVAGVQFSDKGQVTIENIDGNNGRMEGYRSHFSQHAGLRVKDWRYVVRIANIDYSLLSPDASTGANLIQLMFEALERLPSGAETSELRRCGFYMSRDVRTKVRQQMENRVSNSTLTVANVGGVKSPTFQEIPLRRCDSLAVDEARVV